MVRITPVVKHLIITNVVIYIALLFAFKAGLTFVYEDYFMLHKSNLLGFRETVEQNGKEYYPIYANYNGQRVPVALRPADNFKPIQIVTHFFSHSLADLFHILFNMLALFFIGPMTEMVLGSKRFLKFYLFCGVVGGILIAFLDPNNAPVVGASGAVMGVLVAFAIFFPRQKLYFMFIPIGIEARWLVTGIGVLSAIFVYLDWIGADSIGSISHFGHLAGMIAALMFFYLGKAFPKLLS
ncbi:MAG: rhomboid family intramembrane serine protease [Bacteroidetes bacterium]|nr:MAG: rhomboid family intramembrane serine protease [Bacteroidota bacterium]